MSSRRSAAATAASRAPGPQRERRRTLPDHVVEELGRRIVRGEFAQRGLLPPELALAGQLGVSRNVLREAIKVLTSKGLIEVRPKIGTRVRKRRDWNVLDADVLHWFSGAGKDLRNAHDFVEFRCIIEPQAAYLAAIRANEADVATMRAALAALEACVGHPERVPLVDIAFHRSIYDASHNIVLQHLGSLIAPLMQTQVVLTIAPAGEFERGLPLHRGVVEAIARGNARRAEARARALVTMPYEFLNRQLHPDNRGLLK